MTQASILWKRWANSQTFRSVGILAGGTLISQLINAVMVPLVTRLYTPEEFGVFTLFFSIIALAVPISALRLETAIPLPRKEGIAQNLLFISITFTIILCSFLSLFLYFGNFLDDSTLHPYYPILIVGILGASIYQTLTYWTTRQKAFRHVSSTRIMQSLVQGLVQAILGFYFFGPFGLMLGFVVAQFCGISKLIREGGIAFSWIRLRYWKRIIGHYRLFPLYHLPSTIISTAGSQAYPLFFSFFYSTEMIGHLGLTLRVLALPSVLISQAIGKVFYPTYSQMNDPFERRHYTLSLFKKMTLVSFIGFGFLALVSPTLFSVFFGSEWAKAGHFARLLCPWFMVSFVSAPLSTIALVHQKQKQLLGITSIETLSRLALLYFGGTSLSIEKTLFMYAMLGVFFNGGFLIWMLHLNAISPSQAIKSLMRYREK